MIKKYILAPYVRVGSNKKQFSLGFGSIQKKIDDLALALVVVQLLKFLKTPRALDEIKNYWDKIAVKLDSKIKDNFFEDFLDGNYIIGEKDYVYSGPQKLDILLRWKITSKIQKPWGSNAENITEQPSSQKWH